MGMVAATTADANRRRSPRRANDCIWSGRWESNPRNQLGRLAHYHCATPAFAHRLVARRGFEPLISGLKGRRPSPLDQRARRPRFCRKLLPAYPPHNPPPHRPPATVSTPPPPPFPAAPLPSPLPPPS